MMNITQSGLSENSRHKLFLKKVKSQKFFLIALIPFLGYLFLFKYYPMYGAIIAFKDFSFRKGILGSSWVGLKYFKMFLTSPDLFMVVRNTLVMSTLNIFLVAGASILFALLVCEIRNKAYKKIVQTISYLPNFISWIVVVGMAMTFFSIDSGVVNNMLTSAGIVQKPVNFLGDVNIFWWLVTGLNIWKSAGWNSIIYIAAITSLDVQMFESAIIDGAGKMKQIFYITIPSILPTVILLFIFSLGYILNAGFEQQYFLQNPLNYTHAEVLDTYVFKYGLQKSMYSYGAAVGLIKSVIGLMLVLATNQISRKLFKMSIF